MDGTSLDSLLIGTIPGEAVLLSLITTYFAILGHPC